MIDKLGVNMKKYVIPIASSDVDLNRINFQEPLQCTINDNKINITYKKYIDPNTHKTIKNKKGINFKGKNPYTEMSYKGSDLYSDFESGINHFTEQNQTSAFRNLFALFADSFGEWTYIEDEYGMRDYVPADEGIRNYLYQCVEKFWQNSLGLFSQELQKEIINKYGRITFNCCAGQRNPHRQQKESRKDSCKGRRKR